MRTTHFILAVLCCSPVAAQPIVLDELTTAQSVDGEIAAPEAIGGARYLRIPGGGASASIGGGLATVASTTGGMVLFYYDGQVDQSSSSHALSADLTAGGNDRIELEVVSVTGAPQLLAVFFNGTGGSCFLTVPVTSIGTLDVFFDGSSDCTSLAAATATLAIRVDVDAGEELVFGPVGATPVELLSYDVR